jgi:uncharacterized repeat protein (TIGR03803 family)
MRNFESKQDKTEGLMANTVQHREWYSGIRRRAASCALALAVVIGLGVASTQSAQAQAYQAYKESVIYSFTDGADGGGPSAGLIFDAKGDLYGTTRYGGGNGGCGNNGGCGVVFKLSSKGKEITLYNFTGHADGYLPGAGLIFDAKGNLYGTTLYSVTGDPYGAVYKLGSKGKIAVLHDFGGLGDGGNPWPSPGLIFDAKGNLYGTTQYGFSNKGVVFKLGPEGKFTPLHAFTGDDGAQPLAGVIRDTAGNLYGTTLGGGASGFGVVFKLGSKGKETVLHSFTGGADGGGPSAGLIFDAKGNLYGTTTSGGASGFGVVFKLSSKGKETVLYSFTGGADGGNPSTGLILDAKGNLYGTAPTGGASGFGVVFKLTP